MRAREQGARFSLISELPAAIISLAVIGLHVSEFVGRRPFLARPNHALQRTGHGVERFSAFTPCLAMACR